MKFTTEMKEREIIDSFHHVFPQNLLPWQPYDLCIQLCTQNWILLSYLENMWMKSSQTPLLDVIRNDLQNI